VTFTLGNFFPVLSAKWEERKISGDKQQTPIPDRYVDDVRKTIPEACDN
jgi:hypothetical protein